mmetsp:Transcript_14461/g.23930  ORF Transcript_14461/g.23930 Transcript_14461/m.23930 type:complete len:226 (-) Transcript_14461:146-823(-)
MLCCCAPSNPPASKSTAQGGPSNASNKTTDVADELVGVTIPNGMGPGQNLLIQHPSGNGQVVSATIPNGHHAGSVFYVRFPASNPVVIAGVPVVQQPHKQSPGLPQTDDFASGFGGGNNNNQQYRPPAQHQQQPQKQQGKKKYKRCSEEMLMLHNKGLVKIKVPPNLKAGDKMRVQIPDGRMINATVPPGNVSDFHVKVPPKKQNFHDNPIAVHAPMALGPLMMM